MQEWNRLAKGEEKIGRDIDKMQEGNRRGQEVREWAEANQTNVECKLGGSSTTKVAQSVFFYFHSLKCFCVT